MLILDLPNLKQEIIRFKCKITKESKMHKMNKKIRINLDNKQI